MTDNGDVLTLDDNHAAPNDRIHWTPAKFHSKCLPSSRNCSAAEKETFRRADNPACGCCNVKHVACRWFQCQGAKAVGEQTIAEENDRLYLDVILQNA